MSNQNVLDPALSTQYTNTNHQNRQPLPPPFPAVAPRPDGLKADGGAYATQQSPQPYYYPSPQTNQTPQQSGVGSAQHSSQTSPENAYQSQPPAEGAGSPDNGDGAEDAKRPRACEACRNLKVRCDQDPAHPEIPCKRCAKAGRQCIITQPSRKRQKKADSRVAELEKKLDALTAALHQQQQATVPQFDAQQGGGAVAQADMLQGRSSVGSLAGQYPPPPPPRMGTSQSGMPSGSNDFPGPPAKRKRTDGEFTGSDASFQQPSYTGEAKRSSWVFEESKSQPYGAMYSDLRRYLPYSSPEEFVKQINTIISPDMAAQTFHRYCSKLAPNLPAVVFPSGTTAEQVFREKPILYVCILSAASHGNLHPDIAKKLTREAVGAIADCVVRSGAKSLELIQAMQVFALWYKPPEKAEQTNFYQIIHMAAVMALDIGLGKRFNPAKAERGFGGRNAKYAPGPGKMLPQDSDTVEARRAWLGCYYLCASASMVLRRPNLVRWTNYMKECIEVLESHPDALPSDKVFCQYVKIQHICEEIGLQFLMDDNTANISITDPKVTYALNILETQLKHWKENIPANLRTPNLMFFEHVTSLYLHEIALHFDHNVEDFRMPFTEASLKSVNNTSDTLTQNQIAALEACHRAAHGILDTMLGFDIHVVKTLPMLIYFVRCIYALVILIKMHVAVCTPGSELGKMMKPEDLRVEYYMDSLITMFSFVAKEEEFRPHPKILRILNVLREWFGKHKENVAAQSRGEPIPHPTPTVEKNAQLGQTPLHLLSQVANQQRPPTLGEAADGPAGNSQQHDWTFSNPSAVNYAKGAPANDPATGTGYSTEMPYGADQNLGLVDPMNMDYGWGSGFEQAMDIALYDTDGLQQGGGLDSWFLGDSVAPFGFNGDMGQGW
ncbi:uncharacterized protein LTR77_008677 [Saxophila tyrrhenica]|uniref:Zn(2)-C6 fungal-type domain-containing protein n=1 Tax=Saxophila tyrrhenica TaxID=1690608 RepID=A0AAV9P3T7_9PEZI|nr:hypothetical protein LTR77_008677 [Saxophila tyrrhenica]